MNIIDNLRKNILYFFTGLPFVIVIYEFLMLLTLGNMGYAVLLVGQLGFVPIAIMISTILFSTEISTTIFALLTVLSIVGVISYVIYNEVKK
jgi:hypothetical protein